MALCSVIGVGKILTQFLLLKATWLKNIEFVESLIMANLDITSAMFVKVGFIQKVLEKSHLQINEQSIFPELLIPVNDGDIDW